MGKRAAALLAGVVAALPHASSAASFTRLFRHATIEPALVAVDAAPDGSTVAGGALDDDAWLVRCHADGSVAWQRWFRFGPSERWRIVDVAALPSGRTLVLAERWHVVGVSPVLDAVLIRVGPAGDFQHAIAVEGTPIAVGSYPDGSALVLSRRTGNLITCLTRHDPSGAVQWTKDLVGPATNQAIGDVRVLANGTFAVAVGGSWSAPGTSAWIGVCEAGAVVLWERTIVGHRAARTSLAPMSDGGVVLMTGDGSPGETATLHRFAADGSTSWRRSVRLGSTSTPLAIDTAADDGTIVLATSQRDGAVVVRVDAAGRSQWARSMGVDRFGVDPTLGGGVVLLPDGIVAAGSFEAGGPATVRTAAVVKTDLAGNVDGCLVASALPQGDEDLPASLLSDGATFVTAPTPPSAALSLAVTGGPAADLCALPCAADAQEPDDGCGTATSRGAAPIELAGNFCNDVDDWMRIETCAQETLTIETDLLGASADTVLEAWSADCSTLLAADDDSAGGRASRLQLPPGPGGAMKIRVHQADETIGPERGYTLRITAQRTPQRTFARRVGPVDEYWPTTAGPRAGGGFAFGGARGRQAWAVATDGAGAVDWSSGWEAAGGPELVIALTPAADGGALLLTSAGVRGGSLLARRVDATGVPAWQAEIPKVGSVSILGLSAAETPDGGFIVAGAVNESMTLVRAWIARLTSTGGVVWQRTLEVGEWATPFSLVALSDGGALVASTSWFEQVRPVAHAIRLDPDGNVLWSRELVVDGFTPTSAFIVATAGGGASLGCTALSPAGEEAIELVGFDAAGGVTWRGACDLPGGASIGALAATADGGLLIGATTSLLPPDGRSRGAVIRLDALGRVAWSRGLSRIAWSSETLGVQEQPDGDVLVAATLRDVPGEERRPPAALVRLDGEGRLGAACRSVSSLVARQRAPRLAVTDPALSVGPGVGTLAASTPASRPIEVEVTDACACACAPAAVPGEVSPVGEPEPLVFVTPDRLAWERSEASGSCTFNLYRGDLARLRLGDYGTCIESGLTLNETVDPALPGLGRAFAYLVTGRADFEGTAGNDSRDRRRTPSTTCP